MNATPQALYALRQALGFSHTQMAAALGLGGARALDTVRELETGRREPSGAVSHVARYLSQGVDVSTDPELSDSIQSLIPRFIGGVDLENKRGTVDTVFHTQWPRFLALYPDSLDWTDATREALTAAGVPVVPMPEHIGGGALVVLWIDDPAPDTERAQRAVTACAQAKTAQAVRDLAD